MSVLRRAIAALIAVLAAGVLLATASPASAAPGGRGAVYVLGNQTTGNEVFVFRRTSDGRLLLTATVPSGGVGTGGGLGSQGAVVLDSSARYLFAVNAGSDSISAFRIVPGGLELTDVVSSGGSRPTSVTVHGGLVYVLNAGPTSNITGFTVDDGDLEPLAGSTLPLSGNGTQPAQVSFSPNGNRLVVTERATNLIDVYDVDADGRAAGPIVVASAGVTPFGFGFDERGHVIVSEAAGGAPDGSSVSSYAPTPVGLQVVSPAVPTTETAACWIATTPNGRFAYAGNAGTNSITGYRVGRDGALTILTPDGKTATAAAGVTDLAVSANGHFLYARLGNGTVGGYVIGRDGSLTSLGGDRRSPRRRRRHRSPLIEVNRRGMRPGCPASRARRTASRSPWPGPGCDRGLDRVEQEDAVAVPSQRHGRGQQVRPGRARTRAGERLRRRWSMARTTPTTSHRPRSGTRRPRRPGPGPPASSNRHRSWPHWSRPAPGRTPTPRERRR